MTNNTVIYASLPNRAEISVGGEDRVKFLQGLITQDILNLNNGTLLYSCLLISNGKFLFDFFVRAQEANIIIDCEGGERAQALLTKLNHYKLRSKVIMTLIDNIQVKQIWGGQLAEDNPMYKDPRHDDCGYRYYGDKTLQNGKEVDFSVWDKHRIKLEIPDGSRDLIPEKSFIHESTIVTKAAVSYKKGCYMGQELVSRMHHRGLSKKILKCVDMNALPDDCELRSSCGDIGIGLVRV